MSEEAAKINPSIVVLKTGEKLITILQEVFEGEGEDRKGVCLVMSYPYELSLISVPNETDPEKDLQVKYSKWCPYSIDNTFRIPYDGILTIGTPDPGLARAYEVKVESSKASVEPMTEKDASNSPNWQMQQELVQQAIADASSPEEEAITPEVV